MSDLAKLEQMRSIAAAATQGAWVLDPRGEGDHGSLTLIRASHAYQGMAIATTWAQQKKGRLDRNEANAAHIATFDPPTILALLGRLEEVEVGLLDISNPIRVVQRRADEEGRRLSGTAYSIVNDINFVQNIARALIATKAEGA